MLSMREAFAHATPATGALRTGRSGKRTTISKQIQASNPDPSWVTYFDGAKLIVDTGIAHGRLGESATPNL